ncbi:Pre-mRNA-splicing factor cwf14 [Lachnellula cervina]|uniref:Pre-mRNA-splicing factor cwf14 n=1 Tax=Lachnellula cervina TaxID=1316786 RepID=A0A7D8YRA0_9HELO|nr:Pre-mRNA-splicing factor cwf14 [Lachnellula cervina]
MPAIRHASKRKAPPAGFSDIEDDLLIFSNKMKDAEKRPHHQRSPTPSALAHLPNFASEKQIRLRANGYADAMLIAKWKKTGYEKTKETNFNSTCICRVPKAQMKEDQNIECVSCGCRGCASSD